MRHSKQGLAIILFLIGGSMSALSQKAPQDLAAQNAAIVRAHHDLMNKADWKAAVNDFSEDTRNFGRPVGRDKSR